MASTITEGDTIMLQLRGILVVTGLVALLAAGCGGQDETAAAPTEPAGTSSTSSAAGEPVHITVVGDSLAETGWPDLYGQHVAAELGRPVEVEVLTAMGVAEGADLATGSPESLADADIVIVQTGFNNALPDPETGIGCPGSLGSGDAAGILRWIRSTEPTCLSEGVKTFAGLYDQIFSGAKASRAGKSTVFVAMTTVDGNNDPEPADGLIGLMPKNAEPEVLDWTLAAYDRWNTMLVDRADAAGFQVVDLFHAINGPDGSRVVGDLSDDGRHPNARGDDFYVQPARGGGPEGAQPHVGRYGRSPTYSRHSVLVSGRPANRQARSIQASTVVSLRVRTASPARYVVGSPFWSRIKARELVRSQVWIPSAPYDVRVELSGLNLCPHTSPSPDLKACSSSPERRSQTMVVPLLAKPLSLTPAARSRPDGSSAKAFISAGVWMIRGPVAPVGRAITSRAPTARTRSSPSAETAVVPEVADGVAGAHVGCSELASVDSRAAKRANVSSTWTRVAGESWVARAWAASESATEGDVRDSATVPRRRASLALRASCAAFRARSAARCWWLARAPPATAASSSTTAAAKESRSRRLVRRA